MSDAPVSVVRPLRLPTQDQFVRALIRGWKLIIIGALIGVWWAAGDLLNTPYEYMAQMQVTQAQPTGGGAARGTALPAELAGIALPVVQNGSEFRLYVDSLTTRDIANEMFKDANLMHRVFSGEWDESTQQWKQPIYNLGLIARIKVYIQDKLGITVRLPWLAPGPERT